jgi:hypothetical protein
MRNTSKKERNEKIFPASISNIVKKKEKSIRFIASFTIRQEETVGTPPLSLTKIEKFLKIMGNQKRKTLLVLSALRSVQSLFCKPSSFTNLYSSEV